MTTPWTAARDAEPLRTSPLNNLRDLGGIAIAGGSIASGRLFRSDDVSTIPASQADDIVAAGIGTVIDLRSDAESEHTGRGPLGDRGVRRLSLPLTRGGAAPDEFAEHLRADTATPDVVGRYYASTVVAEAETIVRGMRLIADADHAVLFHCQAGKDRTGLFTGALLAALGAHADDIAADYAASEPAVPRIMARVSASIGHLMGDADAFFRRAAAGDGPVSPLLGAEAESMIAMLAYLDHDHAGIPALLRARGGMTDDDLDALRARLL